MDQSEAQRRDGDLFFVECRLPDKERLVVKAVKPDCGAPSKVSHAVTNSSSFTTANSRATAEEWGFVVNGGIRYCIGRAAAEE